MKPSIAIDMDDTIIDTLSTHIRLYEQEFGVQLERQSLHGKQIFDVVPAHHLSAVHAYPRRAEFYADLPSKEGAIEVIAELNQHYHIYIATAAMEYPASFQPKYAWLIRHLPFLSPLNFIFCGDKGILNTDYLIDDSPRHLERFRGQGLLFDAPHNRLEQAYRRVHDWQQVGELFLQPTLREANGACVETAR